MKSPFRLCYVFTIKPNGFSGKGLGSSLSSPRANLQVEQPPTFLAYLVIFVGNILFFGRPTINFETGAVCALICCFYLVTKGSLSSSRISLVQVIKPIRTGANLAATRNILLKQKVHKPYLLLLTSKTFISKVPPWYVNELQEAVRLHSPDGSVQAFVILWEDVLRAYNPCGG